MNFLEALQSHSLHQPDQLALQVLSPKGGRWLTWSELWDAFQETVFVLQNLGVMRGNRIGILSENSLPWILLDLACHQLHAVSVPLNTQLSQSQLAEQLKHSGVSLLFTEALHLPLVDAEVGVPIVVTGGAVPESVNADLVIIGAWNSLVTASREGRSVEIQNVRWAVPASLPDRIASIVYTSGTTGEAKGVMLTEDNLVFNAEMALKRYQFDRSTHQFNFLPFFHAFGRTCDFYVWLLGGHQLTLASDRQAASHEVAQANPTHINGVPYFFEKLLSLSQQNEDPTQTLGERLIQINSGGATLMKSIFDGFTEIDVAVLEGYGLTETSPVATLAGRDAIKYGSVGRALDQTEIKINSEGEVIIRGRHVCAGYYRNAQESDQLLSEGWLRTGDLGTLDEDGFLYLTGRKTELIVTSSGKNIWPQTIEQLLSSHEGIEQVMVVGDQQKFLTAIIVPNWEYFADSTDVSGTPEQWKDSPNVERWFQYLVDQCLENRAAYEQIGQLVLMSDPWTSEAGQLTAKGTLRRGVIKAQLVDVLDRLYRG